MHARISGFKNKSGISLRTKTYEDRIVIAVKGSLTMATASSLGQALSDLIDQGHRDLVLDTGGLTECDGAGWTMLSGIHWRLVTMAGSLTLEGAPASLLLSCRRMELAEVFTFAADPASAEVGFPAPRRRRPVTPAVNAAVLP